MSEEKKAKSFLELAEEQKKAFLESLAGSEKRLQWVKCSKCGEEFTKLMESGECVLCDPMPEPHFTPTKKKASVDDILEVVDHTEGKQPWDD